MKVAIMQPYLFPYLGYFQLINSVDKFVIHDDVQFIKGGWINKNKILMSGEDFLITLPVIKDNYTKKINERFYCQKFDDSKIIRVIENAYRKAPFFSNVFKLIEDIFIFNNNNVSLFNYNQLKILCNYLEIKTEFYNSSDLKKNNTLKGEARVVDIVQLFSADTYINPIGGLELYGKDYFALNNIKLFFLKTNNISYKQYNNAFVPSLSIIDIMMFNDKEKINYFLQQFILI